MLLDLPLELQVHVLSFLDYHTVCTIVSLISTEFHSLSNDGDLWRSLYLITFPFAVLVHGGKLSRTNDDADGFYKREFQKEWKIWKKSMHTNKKRSDRAKDINAGSHFEVLSDLTIKFIGDRNSGKTSLVGLYSTDRFISDYLPTESDDLYLSFTMAGTKRVALRLCDTPGDRFSSFDDHESATDIDVFVLCFSLVDQSSLTSIVKKWNPLVRRHYLEVPRILVGMKNDLRDSQSKDTISYERGFEASRRTECISYVECSSFTREGVDQLFQEILFAVVTTNERAGTTNGRWEDYHTMQDDDDDDDDDSEDDEL